MCFTWTWLLNEKFTRVCHAIIPWFVQSTNMMDRRKHLMKMQVFILMHELSSLFYLLVYFLILFICSVRSKNSFRLQKFVFWSVPCFDTQMWSFTMQFPVVLLMLYIFLQLWQYVIQLYQWRREYRFMVKFLLGFWDLSQIQIKETFYFCLL